MREILRVMMTGAIWVTYSLLGLALFWMAFSSGAAFFFLVALGILGVLTLAAGILTSRVWRGATAASPADSHASRARRDLDARPVAASYPRKAKRDLNARVARLIEDLDDDELLELETLLTQDEEDAILS